MKPGRVVALIVGCLLLLPGIGLLFGGGALGLGYAFGRDDNGYFQDTLEDVQSPTAAIITEDLALTVDAGSPAWLVDTLAADVRLRVGSSDTNRPIFVGVGPAADVAAYLDGVAHDQIIEIADGRTPVYRTSAGGSDVAPPAAQPFWVTSAAGSGTQELAWKVDAGRWAVVVMNADGSPGVAVVATIGLRVGSFLPVALILLALGALIAAGAVVLIVVGASGRSAGPAVLDSAGAGRGSGPINAPTDRPVVLTARLDHGLSRWRWLLKWFLAIPHFLVLAMLWPAFVVVTVIAGFAILATGRYPRSLFEFNLGVLRWSWRASYYATHGGLGTDRYPPFTLGPVPDYPATLDIVYPAHLSRGLVLVKWWLLAIPHYLILGVLLGGGWGWAAANGDTFNGLGRGVGVLGLLVLIAAIVLLITGNYPRALFDLIIGSNRWIYRVIAYAALMTDHYPPFRLDQGGSEPVPTLPPRPGTPPAGQHSRRTPEPAGSGPSR